MTTQEQNFNNPPKLAKPAVTKAPEVPANYVAAWKKYADLREKALTNDPKVKAEKAAAFQEVRNLERHYADAGVLVRDGGFFTPKVIG